MTNAALPALSAAQIQQHLGPGWALVEGAIQKRYGFDNFHQTMAFVNAVAWLAHQADHHPDLQVAYGHCTVRFHTHDVHGVSMNDMLCAAQVDALFA